MDITVRYLLKKLFSAFMDVLPIILVIAFFQIFVIQQPFPNLQETLLGVVLVIIGLLIFIEGLETALFPLGERMANQFAAKGNLWWIMFFGFALGFSTTIAEPALTVIAGKAGQLASQAGAIGDTPENVNLYVLGLRITIALSVGLAIAIGVVRIIKGWPLIVFI